MPTMLDNLLAWCCTERVGLQRQLDLMEAGTMRIGEHLPGESPRDTTAASIKGTQRKIAELDDILARPHA
jgi:hypothetical protein